MKRHVKSLRRIVTNLDVIATTLLEVETLDAEQIRHLADHGTLPDRSKGTKTIDASTEDIKVNISKKDEDAQEDNKLTSQPKEETEENKND